MKLTYLWTRVESYYIHIKCFQIRNSFYRRCYAPEKQLYQAFFSYFVFMKIYIKKKWLKFHRHVYSVRLWPFCKHKNSLFMHKNMRFAMNERNQTKKKSFPQTEFSIKSSKNALITKIKPSIWQKLRMQLNSLKCRSMHLPSTKQQNNWSDSVVF